MEIDSTNGVQLVALADGPNSQATIGTQSNHKFGIRTNNAQRITVSAAGAVQFNTGYGAGVIQADSSGNLTSTAPGTSGNVLTSNGTAWVSQASSTGANQQLSNLSGTVAANLSISPTSTIGTQTLGTATNFWGFSYISALEDGSSHVAVDPFNRILQDASN